MSNIQTKVKSELGHGLALQNLISSTELWGFARQKKYLEEKQINYTFQIKYFTMSGGEGCSCCSLSNLKKILLFSRFMQLCCNIYATKVQCAKHIGH